MADQSSQYGSDLNKLIIELQYRVGGLENKMDAAQSFILQNTYSSTPTGQGIAGKIAIWLTDAQLGTSTVLQESPNLLTITGDIISDANNTRDIGSTTNFFANTYSVNVAASAVATDTLGDATAGFIELADVPFQPATSGGASLGISGKEFSDIWALAGHMDTLSDVGAGFVELQDIPFQPATSGGTSLGISGKEFSELWAIDAKVDSLDIATASDIELRANLVPDTSITRDLGSPGLLWDGVFSQAFAYSATVFHLSGTGSPETNIVADIGSTYSRIDGGPSTAFYVKEADNGLDTGWVAYGAAGAGGANTALSNLANPTNINQSLISQGDGLSGPANNLGSSAHHWNDEYVVRLLNTGTGNIDVQANWRPDIAQSFTLGAIGRAWSDLVVSQEPSRIYFDQAGTTPSISTGSVAPNGTITADIGSLFLHKTGTAGAVLWIKETNNGGNTGWVAVNPAGTSPPGSDQQIIYNNSGGFAADANLVWDYTNHQFQVGGSGAAIFTSGQFWGANGSAGTPSYSWLNSTTMGFFRQAADSIGIATSSTERWRIDSNGMLKAVTDNTLDIGQNGLFRPRTIYLAKSVKVDGGGTTINEGVRTPIISNDNLAAVRFFDTLEPAVDGAGLGQNCGSAGKAWVNVYSYNYRIGTSPNLGWTFGTAAPSGGTPTGGSIYSRTSGTQTLYVFNGTTWVDVLGGAGGANVILGNLTVGGVRVNTDLEPDLSGNNRLLGTLARTWGQAWINTVNTNNIGTLTGVAGSDITFLNDHLPTSDVTLDNGTGARRWSQVGTSQITWTASGVLDEAGNGVPGFFAPTGSVYRNIAGSSGNTLYVREAGLWKAVLTAGGAGAFATTQLNNLAGTAVNADILSDFPGSHAVGGSGQYFASMQALNGTFDRLNALLSTTLTTTCNLIPLSAGNRNIGSLASYWASMFAVNLAVTNIVPNTSINNNVAIGSNVANIFLFLGGVARQVTTTPTATPLYVI